MPAPHRRPGHLVAVILAAFLTAVPAHAQDSTAPVRDVLRDMERAYAAADPSQVLAVMTEDVVLLQPGGEPVRGRAEAGDRYRNLLSRGPIALQMVAHEIRVADGWAVAHGTQAGSRRAETGEVRSLTGKFMMILDRTATGSWQIRHMIWNDDDPPER